MFTYGEGESFEQFEHCNQEADTKTESCVDNPPTDIKRICGSKNKGCLVDGCAGGPDDAKKYVETQEQMTDKMCGKQVFHENFNEIMDGPWGDIYQKDEQIFASLQGKLEDG